ncbi:hypothetical protein SAMN02745164_00945 [Marinitoga hydrogenitolerans DSM 16785]|uniref:Uncharacterized protein n=1 Tax=Marinitoga hydrogenitolerans (strain DSM 16785 / JCM 12826 / AT1271) TaxID=1122195 RepID=A0A1M4VIV8_MARH1|nr:hypothetical protein SAMN02745164_00945 [Marinitoga hydrogenitolerans DSM 16785]
MMMGGIFMKKIQMVFIFLIFSILTFSISEGEWIVDALYML